ncbi:protein NRT1/ PTR FAMILY 7.3-like [Canna indica]|uniref:Protein NRT1/ PTR FAMILY 7.3-like n=1 Tax=Canna indica TaxID=4628 RepID=A0AAQ3L2I7_9LILI|nr:protein NRT1/ PTR FAMILY 7.3-like [Canna indica]
MRHDAPETFFSMYSVNSRTVQSTSFIPSPMSTQHITLLNLSYHNHPLTSPDLYKCISSSVLPLQVHLPLLRSCTLYIPRSAVLSMVHEQSNSKGSEMNKAEQLPRELEMKLGVVAEDNIVFRERPAAKGRSGGWVAGNLLLVNQGLATLAFFGVNVNLVLFLTRVLQQNNADAANNVSKWTGAVYIFSLLGAFLSDSDWGRYKTCIIFQVVFVLGLMLLSLSSHLFLIKPSGCGDQQTPCGSHSNVEVRLFYLAIYMIALGNGGYQPNIASFGADQFDEDDPDEAYSKVSFFSYFYLALNVGSLFSNTCLSYMEDHGMWALGFWASTLSAFVALAIFFGGARWYRHCAPGGNPLSRFCRVVVAASRKWRAEMLPGGGNLYEVDGKEPQDANGISRRILHTEGFKFLDRAAVIDSDDFTLQDRSTLRDHWRLCTITQVEEVKCVLRLLPIWLCTILYSVVFTQMASLFVVQGAAMQRNIHGFTVPPSSMSAFDILSVVAFIFLCKRLLHPLVRRLKNTSTGLTELQRMGVGLVIAATAMVSAGVVEHFRLKHQYCKGSCTAAAGSSLHIMWQAPQYVLIGASEVFMYVGQLEFFNGQAPDGLKSFGSALCMTSIAFGNFFSDLIVTIVMGITGGGGRRPGWIPANLNDGHLDRFYFLLAVLCSVNLVVYMVCAKWYKRIKVEGKCGEVKGGF